MHYFYLQHAPLHLVILHAWKIHCNLFVIITFLPYRTLSSIAVRLLWLSLSCWWKQGLNVFNVHLHLIEHWLCIDWSVTVFHTLWNLQIEWPVLSICPPTHFSQLASCLLWRCALLVFVIRCLVCCRRVSGVPQCGYRTARAFWRQR
jgi:hypothetical protein